MPTEAQIRAHESAYASGSGPQPVPSHNTYSTRSLASTSANPRPTLNIYANTRGDLAYEPDARWSRQFNNKGYKINIHRVEDVEDISGGNSRLFSQYAMQPNGALAVNGHSVPMLDTEFGKVSVVKGYEHGRTYVPNSPHSRPKGEIREKLEPNETSEPQDNCDLCWAGFLGALLVACIVPCCCCCR